MEDRYSVLKRVFGYDRFRPGQEQIIEALLRGQDVMAVMPTGAGKSVCYQVPALLLPGLTLVISPLISLMQDQVRALVAAGVPAAYLNNSLNDRQKELMLRRAREGQYKIIYVAPERLLMPGFAALVHCRPVSMVTVDEAHCISQWGHDFRPSYLQIRTFVEGLAERPVVGAFTATATGQVRRDIEEQLGLRSPLRLVTGFDRPNLRFETQRLTNSDKPHALVDLLLEAGDVPVIVYCSTVRQVEQTAQTLQGLGFAAAAHHGQLPAELRRRTQADFLSDRLQVMVATNAFGMGIDKPNVRMVVHYNMPRDLESYYQEAGRAGRDGEPARCVLLYAPSDVRTAQFFIDKEETEGTGPLVQRQENARLARERLRYMTFYATTQRCLRAELLHYFGQKAPVRCGNCSSCLQPKTVLPAPRPAAPRARPAAPAARAAGLGPGDQQLLAALYAVRKELARRDKLPAFTVCSDAALRQLCTRRPASMAQLLEIPGINEARAQRYGPALLDAVRRYG